MLIQKDNNSLYIYKMFNPFFPAPPTYAECQFGKVNIKDDEDSEYTRGNLEYAPRYTYYNWGNEPQPYVNSEKYAQVE